MKKTQLTKIVSTPLARIPRKPKPWRKPKPKP